MTAMIRSMEASLDRVERIKGEKNIDDRGGDISLKSYDIVFDHVNTALSACHASTVSAISNTLLGHISIKHLRKNLPLCTITAVRRGSWQRR